MEFQPIMRALWRNPDRRDPRRAADRARARDRRQFAVHHRPAPRAHRARSRARRGQHVHRVVRADRAGLQRRSRDARRHRPAAVAARRCRCDDDQLHSALRRRLIDACTTPSPARKARKAPATTYEVDEHGINTLGVRLVEGRNFDPSRRDAAARQLRPAFVPEVIVTRAFAKELFPDGSALGKTLYDGLGQPTRIVGHYRADARLVGRLGQARQRHAVSGRSRDERFAFYLVRAKPGQRDAMMRLAEDKLRRVDNGRIIIKVKSVEEIAAKQLCRRSRDGGLPERRHRAAARDQRARDLRPRRLQRQHAHQADRHAPGDRRPTLRHRALLHGRELAGDHGGRAGRLRARAAARVLAVHDVRTAAAEALLSRRGRGGAVGRSAWQPPGCPRDARRACRRRSRRERSRSGTSASSNPASCTGASYWSSTTTRPCAPRSTCCSHSRGRASQALQRPPKASRAWPRGDVDLVIQDMNFRREATSGQRRRRAVPCDPRAPARRCPSCC